MSQVSSYAYADDGMWYRDPTLGVEGKWFICFDDDDPIELVVFEGDPDEIVKDLPFKVTGRASRSFRMVAPFYKRAAMATAYWLKMTGPFPKRLMFNQAKKGMTKQQVYGQGVFYGFDYDPNWRKNG